MIGSRLPGNIYPAFADNIALKIVNMRNDIPFIIGHRGAARHAPENTLASIRRAAQLGAKWVEFDVKLSRDGVLILFHDDTLARTTDGAGRPEDPSFEQLGRLDAGSWFSPDFAGERIPSLVEAIQLLIELGLGGNVEIKPAPGQARETALAVAAVLGAEWAHDQAPPVVSSFSEEALEVFAEARPDADRALLVGRLPKDWRARADRLGCSAVHMSDKAATKKNVSAVLEAGFAVRVYTINDPGRMVALRRLGVQSVFTDDPAIRPS
ncbi:MAG: glycerophosphodiester phosphodiesterase [Proteobacteria bacterium]|nr:glycerophosphodiester phosphodiesterase [Pseudomonadota bacterium]